MGLFLLFGLFFEKIADFFEKRGLVFFDFSFGFFLFVFFFLGEFFSAFAHFVERADHEEDNEGDNEEINGGLEEIAVVYGGGFNAFNVGRDGEF